VLLLGVVGGRFLTRVGGKIMVTPLFVALVAIETTDLVFALDSIPAVFGVTLGVIILTVGSAVAASLWRDRALAKRDGLVPD
jgi:tellurite resistance protein TerC